MMVMSTPQGYVLVFRSKGDLETVTSHLQGYLESLVEDPTNEPPYLYATYDDRVSAEEMRGFLQALQPGLAEFFVNAPEKE